MIDGLELTVAVVVLGGVGLDLDLDPEVTIRFVADAGKLAVKDVGIWPNNVCCSCIALFSLCKWLTEL
jgi:hypothetical protein